jgi:hypothetical protein
MNTSRRTSSRSRIGCSEKSETSSEVVLPRERQTDQRGGHQERGDARVDDVLGHLEQPGAEATQTRLGGVLAGVGTLPSLRHRVILSPQGQRGNPTGI